MVANISGQVLIVMAPMASGKSTIVREALSRFPEIYHTVSCTTRLPRPGEKPGHHYHFLTQEEFAEKIAKDEFLEWANFGGNKYGTLKSEIIPRLQNGELVIAEIEVQGVEQLHELLPSENITTVYIDAGPWEILKERALRRAPMSEEELKKRHERYLIEVASKDIADIILDNTEEGIEKAHAAFSDLIKNLYKKIQ